MGPLATPRGQNTCHAKNTARFTITPTTAAVMPVSGAVNASCAVRRLDERPAGEDEQERRQEREERRDARAGDAGERERIRRRAAPSSTADEADERDDHDERSRRRLAEREAVDHLRRREPAVGLDRALVDVGQHRVGAAERQQRGLA